MSIEYFTKQEIRRARARVPGFVRSARALLAAGFTNDLLVASALLANSLDHLRVENLKAVLIYRAPTGGYDTDLLFDHVPLGIGDVLGTTYPMSTRGAAEDAGVLLVATLLHRQSRRPELPPAPEHALLFHGLDFRVPMAEVIPEVRMCEPDLELAIRAPFDTFVAGHLEGE